MENTIETQRDICCDVCDANTRVAGYGNQFGSLKALWGYGSAHDGERYRVHLCETCFFGALAYLRQERRIASLFDEKQLDKDIGFGLIARDDLFGES